MEAQTRRVARVIEPQPVVEGAGVRLRRSIGGRALDYLDPFLLLDHFESDDPNDYLAGFPLHPHRGIETVTYMLAGEVGHKDTIGNAGTIGPGDVQWMTAGGGLLHEEMPRPREGKMGGFQLWVNMPAKLKMSRPRYQEVADASIPIVERPDGTRVRVVAGSRGETQGPVTEIYADPEYLDVELAPGSDFTQPVPRGHAAFAYVFRGEAEFGGEGDLGYRGDLDGPLVQAPSLVVFEDGDEVRVHSWESPVRFLLVSGAPLGEPIARYGPFVMNTREEIEQALEDLHAGTFIWSEERELELVVFRHRPAVAQCQRLATARAGLELAAHVVQAARVDSAVAAGLIRRLAFERTPADALVAPVDQLDEALGAGRGGQHLAATDGTNSHSEMVVPETRRPPRDGRSVATFAASRFGELCTWRGAEFELDEVLRVEQDGALRRGCRPLRRAD